MQIRLAGQPLSPHFLADVLAYLLADVDTPWENGYAESFNSRFRDEFLEAEQFESVLDAKEKGAWFRREYNTVRPHSSLGYKTPKEFRDQCEQRRKKRNKKDKRGI